MTIYEPVRARLLGDPSIAALVGTRVYPLRMPAKPATDSSGRILPVIVLTKVSGTRATPLNASASLARPRIQVDCWAPTNDQATALGNLCRARLESYNGTYTDADSVTVRLQTSLIEEHDLFDDDINGGSCRHSADYFAFHSTNGGTI